MLLRNTYSARFVVPQPGTQVTDAILKFRRRVFVDQRGWNLEVDDFGREIDQFDSSDTVYCVLIHNKDIIGTFRAIRTDQPYLAKNIFPDLAIMTGYPSRSDIWEISRFGVAEDCPIPNAGLMNYALMIWFAQQVRATSLVAVTDLIHERLLHLIGIRTRRYGPPQIVGHDKQGRKLRAVAGEIPMLSQDKSRLAKLARNLEGMEISDESDVFGPARISA